MRPRTAHTLVLTAFVGPRPATLEGCHRDGNRANNTLVNLYWGTRSDNQRDRVRHGMNALKQRECCPREHLLTEPNLVAHKLRKGWRNCLACHKTHGVFTYRKARGLPPLDFLDVSNEFYKKIMTPA